MEFQVVSSSSKRLKREDCFHPKRQCTFGNLKLSSVFDTPYGNSTHQSVHTSTHQSVHTPYGNSTHQSVRTSTHQSVHTPYGNSTHQSVHTSTHQSVHTSYGNSTHQSVHTSYGNSTHQSVPYGWIQKKSVPAKPKNKKKSVPCRSVVVEYYSPTCEATLDDGSACRRAPVEGRKRCWQHKGMWGYDTGGSSSDICAASTANGSICRRKPVHGRERCEKHRGKRAAF